MKLFFSEDPAWESPNIKQQLCACVFTQEYFSGVVQSSQNEPVSRIAQTHGNTMQLIYGFTCRVINVMESPMAISCQRLFAWI